MCKRLVRYEPPACTSCGTFAPDVLVPLGEHDTRPMCWICAHLVTAHEHAPGVAVYDCGCSGADIYPPDVSARRQALAPISGEIADPVAELVEDRGQVPVVRDERAARGFAISEGIRARRERKIEAETSRTRALRK